MRGCGGSKLLQIAKQRHLRFSLSDGFLRGCCYFTVPILRPCLFGMHIIYFLFFLPERFWAGLLPTHYFLPAYLSIHPLRQFLDIYLHSLLQLVLNLLRFACYTVLLLQSSQLRRLLSHTRH